MIMATTPLTTLIIVALITNGLLAGTFFVFSCGITPALRRVDNRTYNTAFRAINNSILNRWFLTVFMTAPLSSVANTILRAWHGGPGLLSIYVVGAICSVLTFVITVAANVPLNRNLDQATVNTDQQRRNAREQFETRWNHWNFTRTVTSISALALFAISAIG